VDCGPFRFLALAQVLGSVQAITDAYFISSAVIQRPGSKVKGTKDPLGCL
jgi:hypothetical protein